MLTLTCLFPGERQSTPLYRITLTVACMGLPFQGSQSPKIPEASGRPSVSNAPHRCPKLSGESEVKVRPVATMCHAKVSRCIGLSRDYWMDDQTCKECYDCKSVFTAWRRKHHCRICGSSVTFVSVHGSNSPWQAKYFVPVVPPISSRVLDSATTV